MTPAASQAIPTGRVALLFSDIQGSTALLNRLGERFVAVLDEHDRIVRGALAEFGGYEFSNEGDAFGAAFADPVDAAAAALGIQRRIRSADWPDDATVRLRIGLHLGEPRVRGGDYWGEDVHYAARICASAHGGQVVLSSAMRTAAPAFPTESLGLHGLKDFPTPRELFHLSVDGSRPADFPPLRSLSVFRSNLPSIATPVFGRDEVLAELERLLVDDGARLVTVVGPGGVGKTRLAIALGERIGERFSGGVSLVALAQVAPDEIDRAVADAIGAPSAPGHHDRAIVEHLRHRRVLLILDNAEHLTDPVAALAGQLITQCPDLAILSTSQTPLGTSAETVRRLGGLTVPEGPDEEGSAVTMFVARARARDAGFELTPADRTRLADLCRTVDGMPLAIELAAARVRLVGVEQLLWAVQRDPDALGRGPADLPARQRGLRAVLDWTVGLLDERDRAAFLAFGAFSRAWSIDQAERFLGGPSSSGRPGAGPLEVWDTLTRLTDLSLVMPLGDGRFTMSERVRRHAVALLDASPHRAWWRRRHAEVLADEMATILADLPLDHVRMLANAEDLMEDYLRALAWARADDSDVARHLLAVGGFALLMTGRIGMFADDLPALMPDSPDELLTADDAGVLVAAAAINALSMSTDVAEETQHLRRAASAYERLGLVREALRVHSQLIDAYWWGNHHDATQSQVEVAKQLAGQLDDDRWRVEVLHQERQLLAWTGDYERTFELLEPWLGRPPGVGSYSRGVHVELAECLAHRGHHAAALALISPELSVGGRGGILQALHRIVGVAGHLAALGLDAEAVMLVGGARAAYRMRTGSEHNDGYIPVFLRDHLAAARLRLGDREPELVARGERLGYDELCDLALELIERHGSREELADLLHRDAGTGTVGAVDAHD